MSFERRDARNDTALRRPRRSGRSDLGFGKRIYARPRPWRSRRRCARLILETVSQRRRELLARSRYGRDGRRVAERTTRPSYFVFSYSAHEERCSSRFADSPRASREIDGVKAYPERSPRIAAERTVRPTSSTFFATAAAALSRYAREAIAAHAKGDLVSIRRDQRRGDYARGRRRASTSSSIVASRSSPRASTGASRSAVSTAG